jgi:large subunit ribosomal protein L25
MASVTRHVELAKTLPPRLLRFFARYPPQKFAATSIIPTNTATTATTESPNGAPAPSEQPPPAYENPFQNTKHPITGNWHDPVYSLRRQADLVKLARAHGVEELLPFTTKGTLERIRKREENGLRVKGTGVGQRVKGKWWERNIRVRLEKRRQAMLGMPQMVQTWKQVNFLCFLCGAMTDSISSLVMDVVGRNFQSRMLFGRICDMLAYWDCPDCIIVLLFICIALGVICGVGCYRRTYIYRNTPPFSILIFSLGSARIMSGRCHHGCMPKSIQLISTKIRYNLQKSIFKSALCTDFPMADISM